MLKGTLVLISASGDNCKVYLCCDNPKAYKFHWKRFASCFNINSTLDLQGVHLGV